MTWWPTAALLALLAWLQFALWQGDNGLAERAHLRELVAQRQQTVAEHTQRNQALAREVLALKTDPAAIETRARMDLGMIKPGEIPYQIVPLAQ